MSIIGKQSKKNSYVKVIAIFVFLVFMLLTLGSGSIIQPVILQNKISNSSELGQIDRVDLMPNLPEPFHMRDWKQVAQDYDTFVFNFSKTGDYLPLISWDYSYFNFDRETFSIPAYVGGAGAEAINCMAAVLSATLVGINKSNQNGYNWVEMCENWYNIDTEQFIYLNGKHTRTGSFWYDLLPNLLFYQLAYYYPETGDFQNEIRMVADQWYDACVEMGGKTDPWRIPDFYYTSFNFDRMAPVYNGNWREPEGAAAVAWLEYMAYRIDGDPKYLTAAKWCVQYLCKLALNPLYEILLPYGAYIATRMNAELGRAYDIDKIINWCFGPGDPRVRSGWGVITENWGGYDCHGLHGSITDGGGYAFSMGTYENVGCLVPIVRYDDRYARAIGKYVLNAANAARLFFGNSLDADHQDEEDWIGVYDPDYCIGYEALRKTWNDVSPFATGDAARNGWAETNLGLYGGSHVGIFGGIIAPTNDEKILQLDCLKTDYYHDEAYPTYLYYNPYEVTKTVEIDVGPDTRSLYDTVTESFLVTNVSGITSFQLPSDSAAVVVHTPVDGKITYEETRTLINNVTVDYEPVIDVDVSTWPPETTTHTKTSETSTSMTTKPTSGTKTSPYPSVAIIFIGFGTLVYFFRKKK